MPKEPTKAQLSSKLGYQSHTPSFLLRLQKQIGGRVGNRDQDYDEDEDQFEDDGSGRPPIPVRPSIPERPDDDPGSEDEDDGEEKPQVVVLREGKHLTEREVENEKRKAKGLPPLLEADEKMQKGETKDSSASGSKPSTTPSQSLSFSSGGSKSSGKKRKAVNTVEDGEPVGKKKTAKKPKKAEKKLLSFDDDA